MTKDLDSFFITNRAILIGIVALGILGAMSVGYHFLINEEKEFKIFAKKAMLKAK